MPTLVLLRHGQSQWNLENRFAGWWDVDLSEQGVAEARAALAGFHRALRPGGLMLLCHLFLHLFLTRYRVEVEEPASARMMLAAVPMPAAFRGTIARR